MTEKLTIGLVGTSTKENEKRVPIHPDHFLLIEKSIRKKMYIEEDYGKRFNVNDDVLKDLFAGVLSREELFQQCKIILIAKPTIHDASLFQEKQIIWGWVHCVQGKAITDVALEKKMTYITWESMNIWEKDKIWKTHIFQKNNEIAGYAGVLHSLQLQGITGQYGKKRKAAIIGYGSVARGAAYALKGMGINEITIFTTLPTHTIANQILGINYEQFRRVRNDETEILINNNPKPLVEVLSKYDLIINAIFQDSDNPLIYIKNSQISLLKKDTIIIDISCDEKMGFEFAKPTTFDNPTFQIGNGITYYGVDHTPSFFWNSASYEISSTLIPFLKTVLDGKDSWRNDSVIRNAIEIEDGIIKNPKILTLQKRDKDYTVRDK
ncbi:alanine dehydrogenase [Nanoarchaeota archaeon]